MPERRENCSILPKLGHVELRAAARSFRTETAVGVDALVPTHVGLLSDELLDIIGNLLMAIEEEESGLSKFSYHWCISSRRCRVGDCPSGCLLPWCGYGSAPADQLSRLAELHAVGSTIG